MQAIQRNKTANNNHAGRAAQQYVMGGEARAARLAKRLKSADAAHQDDDCNARYDKISKQMDDIVEGGSPQRFKRPKMESDIIAR
ncbi:MAG: hypothetical protein GAK35_00700 [Herbaspirillum frisingense]|uniref:Uncharacterized protein n=1 Tax=Herbaspirillum frisingense TaxID=92645 RepID=A0A7V8JVG1_9BURK|nr:MAG: hypothetical protein GAK35_00700 [Herbaspirillum frisingense]